MLETTRKWYLMLFAALKATRRSTSQDQTALPSKVLSMLVIEDLGADVEDLEAEEAEDEDTEIPNERENERSAQETKVSGSAEDLLNRDARGDDPTAEMTPAARNLNETGGTIPERSTIVILGQEEEITTQCGLTTTQEPLPARVHRRAAEVGVVDPAVEAAAEAVLDAVEVVVDAVLLITGTVIITSSMTIALDREAAVEMTTTGETPTTTERTVGTVMNEERETRTRVDVGANRDTATAAVPANRNSSAKRRLATALKLPAHKELCAWFFKSLGRLLWKT